MAFMKSNADESVKIYFWWGEALFMHKAATKKLWRNQCIHVDCILISSHKQQSGSAKNTHYIDNHPIKKNNNKRDILLHVNMGKNLMEVSL